MSAAQESEKRKKLKKFLRPKFNYTSSQLAKTSNPECKVNTKNSALYAKVFTTDPGQAKKFRNAILYKKPDILREHRNLFAKTGIQACENNWQNAKSQTWVWVVSIQHTILYSVVPHIRPQPLP